MASAGPATAAPVPDGRGAAGRPVAPWRARWTLDAIATPRARAAAWIIDTTIFWVAWAAGTILLIETGELGVRPAVTAPRALLWLAVVWALSVAYDALSVRRWGSTAGRRVLDIEVRDVEGGLPGPGAATRRSLARTPAVVLLGAGLYPLWSDPRRRGVHDRLAGTMVVRSSALEPADGAAGLVARDDIEIDATETAIRAARLGAAEAGWLRAVAEQTAARLDVAALSWRRGDDAPATQQRAFCLLLAALIARYPGHRRALVAVLDGHAVLDDLTGSRVRHLERLLDDDARARRWLGLADTASIRILVDAPALSRGTGAQPGMRARR